MILGRIENQIGFKLGHDSREKRKSGRAQASTCTSTSEGRKEKKRGQAKLQTDLECGRNFALFSSIHTYYPRKNKTVFKLKNAT